MIRQELTVARAATVAEWPRIDCVRAPRCVAVTRPICVAAAGTFALLGMAALGCGCRFDAQTAIDPLERPQTGHMPSALDLDAEVMRAETKTKLYGLRMAETGDEGWNTLLHVVARAGRVDLARRLIALGFDVNWQNAFAYTPLDYAFQGGRDPGSPIAQCLIEAGGQYNVFRE